MHCSRPSAPIGRMAAASFRTYASRCISNGLAKVAASQLRARNIPLALTTPLDEAGEVSAPSRDEPEEVVIRQEQSLDRSHRMRIGAFGLRAGLSPVAAGWLLLWPRLAGRLGAHRQIGGPRAGSCQAKAAPGADRSGLNCFLFLSLFI